ncbi:hypothetical protein GQ472_00710 [archaeon]|nr:hypothetical protein [archaeon]
MSERMLNYYRTPEGYMVCRGCKSAMLCVNRENTIYRCPICGIGFDLERNIKLESTKKRR